MDHKLKNITKKFTKSILHYDVVNLTITLKQTLNGIPLDKISMEQNLKHFLNILNSNVFGNGFKRYGKRLKILTKSEYSENNRLHLHLILEKPQRLEYMKFNYLIFRSITKTDYFYNQFHIEQPTSHKRKVGWFNYIMKGNLDNSIDWNNTVL